MVARWDELVAAVWHTVKISTQRPQLFAMLMGPCLQHCQQCNLLALVLQVQQQAAARLAQVQAQVQVSMARDAGQARRLPANSRPFR